MNLTSPVWKTPPEVLHALGKSSFRRDGQGDLQHERDNEGMISDPNIESASKYRIFPADRAEHVETVRSLFARYADALDFDLDFQDFDRELDTLPGAYAPPGGALILAESNRRPVGCVGVRPLENDICEMKRLYVEPEARGLHFGRRLARASIEAARRIGYRYMRLDTIGSMGEAIALYRSLGFQEIPAYRPNPIPSARYFELDLERIPLDDD